jgi:DNA-binding transcriptional LysR family regulator
VAFHAIDSVATQAAIRSGVGLGFIGLRDAAGDPDLVQVLPPRAEWDSPLWLVTHVDLHRTRKVQAFLAHLKEAAKAWGHLPAEKS